MPEPLKHLYSIELVESIANECHQYYPKFNRSHFTKDVLLKDWKQLELKERMHRIAKILGECLPTDYHQSIDILLKVAENYSGLAHMCFPDFVEQYGMLDFKTSMMALEKLTARSSSEFAIRPFIIKYPKKATSTLKKWAKSKNEHIRRLASEGCRPRLPWAMALPEYKKDPSAVLEIILKLINDDSLYVRRSIANNLNDISKDHPEVVVDIATQYLGQSKQTDWVIKHACRGLLKQGHKQVLTLFGYSKASHVTVKQLTIDRQVKLGDKLNFGFELKTTDKYLGKLRVEFIIDFMKANGKTAGKIFKICEGEYLSNQKLITKYFSFKPISTRKYYLGKHQLSVVVNGSAIGSKEFELLA